MTAQPRVLMALILVLLIPASVFAQSTVYTRAPMDVSVIACRYCDGDPLSQARVFAGGGTIDATIEFFILDANGNPIAGIPAEDIWVASPNLVFCPGAHVADFPTDVNGYTEKSGPLCAGGCMEIPSLQGFVSGDPITPSYPIPFIKANGPDMDPNLIHDLNDVARFAQCYFDPNYDYCCDFDFDGNKTVVDVWLFTEHFFHGPCN